MDPRLKDFVLKDIPKFNDRVCRGLVYAQSNEIPKYMESLIQSIAVFFPEGLRLDRVVQATPKEHFDMITRASSGKKRTVDISRSDYYMIKLYFTLHGEQLGPYSILVPYFSEGGLFTFRDTQYMVSPVLTDIGYSVYPGKIFIPFARTKYNFHKDHHTLYMDNKRVMGDIYHAPIHHDMKNTKNKSQKLAHGRPHIETTLAHYLFARHGFVEAVKRFAGIDIIVKRYEESDKENYPKTEYVAFSSARWAFTPHPNGNITLYVRMEDMLRDNEYITTLCASFFYVLDAFIDEFDELSDVNVPSFWRLLLGRIIKGDFESRGALLISMDSHMASTDTQLDDMTRDALKERGCVVEDMYGLFHELMTSLKKAYIQTGSEEASVYGKRLTVIPFLLSEFNLECTSLAQKLQGAATRNKELSKQDIEKMLKDAFKLNVCYKTIHKHGEVNPANTPNDNMIHQITSNVVDRENAGVVDGRKKKGRSGMINDPKRKAHVSICEVMQYTNLPKNGPDGRSRVNPTVSLSSSGRIRRKEHLRELTDKTQRMIDEN